MKKDLVRIFAGLLFLALSASLGLQQQPHAVSQTKETAVEANKDPGYCALRDGKPIECFSVDGTVLERDAGSLLLRTGRICFLPKVQGKTVLGAFIGDGLFKIAPATPIEAEYLRRVSEQETFQESFDRAVLAFSDGTYDEIRRSAKADTDMDPKAEDVLRDLHKRLRKDTEENLEAEILTSLYNPNRNGMFRAYLFGKQHKDLRFAVQPEGAISGLNAPEEVALVNGAPEENDSGIWYLAHLKSEYADGTASSGEDKRIIDIEHYQIETVLGEKKLSATAAVSFKAVQGGDRVLRFGLTPYLRISRIISSSGSPVAFIQEKEEEDGGLYVVLDNPLVAGQSYKLTMDYSGEEVIKDAGGGNFFVRARTSWYPSVNAFTDYATFDLKFKFPSKYKLVSVGKEVRQETRENVSESQWVSDIPLTVAGFNFGEFVTKVVTDESTRYQIEGYMVRTVPDEMNAIYIERYGKRMDTDVTTRGLTNVMVEAQNSMRLFNTWFGNAPYERLAVSQQPQFGYAQSWPSLVYLTFQDFLLAAESKDMGLTAHEVSHQWWGHMVGWKSYHDQWLSEGFAHFSAGLYLQIIDKNDNEYKKYWEDSKKAILEKSLYGVRANDAGPVSLGYRLNTRKTPGAYRALDYDKGGFVLNMLRWMLHDSKSKDQVFINMMHDFVASGLHQPATTESFQRIAEKYLPPKLDLDGNGKMNWFFKEWIYGTEIPSYRFEYSLKQQDDGKILLTGRLTQSGVSSAFKMPVPIYIDLDGNLIRLGVQTITGSTTLPEIKVVLPKRPRHVMINANNDVLAIESVCKEI